MQSGGIMASSGDARPPKRSNPPLPPGEAPKKARAGSHDATHASHSAAQSGPFSYDSSAPVQVSQERHGQHSSQSNQSDQSDQSGPFSFKIEAPSHFDKHARNPAALHTYLPPSQVEQHPLSPQQRREQHDLGLDGQGRS